MFDSLVGFVLVLAVASVVWVMAMAAFVVAASIALALLVLLLPWIIKGFVQRSRRDSNPQGS